MNITLHFSKSSTAVAQFYVHSRKLITTALIEKLGRVHGKGRNDSILSGQLTSMAWWMVRDQSCVRAMRNQCPGRAPLRKSCAHPNTALPSHSRNPDAGAGKGSFHVTTEDLKACLCLFSVMPLKGQTSVFVSSSIHSFISTER